MPLGGYCQLCERWVWLNPDGSCERGTRPYGARQSSSSRRCGRRRRARKSRRSCSRGAPTTAGGGAIRSGSSRRSPSTSSAGPASSTSAPGRGGRLDRRRLPLSAAGDRHHHEHRHALAAAGAGRAGGRRRGLGVARVPRRPRYRAIMFGDVPRRGLRPRRSRRGCCRRSSGRRCRPAPTRSWPRSSTRRTTACRPSSTCRARFASRACATKVEQLCRTGEHIVAELGREPRQVELARAFLTYYLEAAQRIVKRYVELGRRESPAEEVRDDARACRGLAR